MSSPLRRQRPAPAPAPLSPAQQELKALVPERPTPTTPPPAVLEKKALDRFLHAEHLLQGKKADRLANEALETVLHRAPTAAEVDALKKDGRWHFERHVQRHLDAKPEVQAMKQADGAARELLGRDGDSALYEQARSLVAEGKSTAEVRAALEATIKGGAEFRRMRMPEDVKASYQRELNRAPTLDETLAGVKQIRPLIDQGQSAEQVGQALTTTLRATPEYRNAHAPDTIREGFQANLNRAPTAEETQKLLGPVKDLIAQGKTPDEVSAAVKYVIALGPEYRKLHVADNVTGEYQKMLGRAPSQEEIDKLSGPAREWIDAGKTNDELNQGIDYCIGLSPEWQAKHPQMNANRDQIYLQQPTGWTCGPTSLAMAMAAAGVRPANMDTVWEMAQGDKLNTIANHSTDKMPWEIADIARSMGVNAEGHAGAFVPEMRAALANGHGIMVNVKEPDTGGHFVYIAGLDPSGQMIVCDPWHPETTTWSDEQLQDYSSRAPGPGNFVEFWRG